MDIWSKSVAGGTELQACKVTSVMADRWTQLQVWSSFYQKPATTLLNAGNGNILSNRSPPWRYRYEAPSPPMSVIGMFVFPPCWICGGATRTHRCYETEIYWEFARIFRHVWCLVFGYPPPCCVEVLGCRLLSLGWLDIRLVWGVVLVPSWMSEWQL